MAKVKPFKGIKPRKDIAEKVAHWSLDNYTPTQINDILEQNPLSFIHVIKAHQKNAQTDKYNAVKLKFKQFLSEGILEQNTQPVFYVYQQHKQTKTYTGIVAAVSVDEYINGNIKVHEQTLSQREELLKEYLEGVQINAEPVLLTYPTNQSINQILDTITLQTPYCSFSSEEGITHQLWEITDSAINQLIENIFNDIPFLFIADGHHRSASSVLLALSKRQKDNNLNAPHNYFMAALFAADQIELLEFNRLVKDLNNLTNEQFLTAISKHFNIQKIDADTYSPQEITEFGMYISGQWYSIKLKPEYITINRLVDKLDVEVLNKHILSPILGINDLRNDKRIAFVGGIKGTNILKQKVDEGTFQVAFTLFPVTMEQFFEIASHDQIMQPKSTWFEPKLLNGLICYDLEN